MKDVLEKLLFDIKNLRLPMDVRLPTDVFALLSRVETVLQIYVLKHRLTDDKTEKTVFCTNSYPNCGGGGVHQLKLIPASECHCFRLGASPEVKVKRCLVKGCPNGSDAGEFIGDLCSPCHRMLTTGEVHSACNTFISKMKANSDIFIRALKAQNTKLQNRLGSVRASLDAD